MSSLRIDLNVAAFETGQSSRTTRLAGQDIATDPSARIAPEDSRDTLNISAEGLERAHDAAAHLEELSFAREALRHTPMEREDRIAEARMRLGQGHYANPNVIGLVSEKVLAALERF